jgi:outer membrane protein OmpU
MVIQAGVTLARIGQHRLKRDMKNQLLKSTALAAVGVLAVPFWAQADKPKLTLGGSTEQSFGVGADSPSFSGGTNTNAGQRVGFDQQSDGELHFNGAVDLDNGIKIRTRVELESTTIDNTGRTSSTAHGTQGDSIDEHWMRISGAFGEIRLGTGDAAAQAMTTGYLGSWATNLTLTQAFDTTNWVTRPSSIAVTFGNRVDVSSDGEHISYFTPRFAGFQLGVSYVPSADEDVNNQRALSGSNADFEGWSAGVNFDRRFGDIGIGLAAGYAFMNESAAAAIDDAHVWGLGGRFDYKGFRIAASWVDKNNQSSTTGTFVASGREAFEIGARYTFGANGVSVSHISAKSDSRNVTANDDRAKSTFIAYRRILGPGVSWHLAAIFADFEDGTPNVAGASSNQGEALVTTIVVVF